jgi:hypothetical protein
VARGLEPISPRRCPAQLSRMSCTLFDSRFYLFGDDHLLLGGDRSGFYQLPRLTHIPLRLHFLQISLL